MACGTKLHVGAGPAQLRWIFRHCYRDPQYGNAVTPSVAEILISALVEAITGEGLDRWDTAAGQWSLAA
jgi:hypothetical protein